MGYKKGQGEWTCYQSIMKSHTRLQVRWAPVFVLFLWAVAVMAEYNQDEQENENEANSLYDLRGFNKRAMSMMRLRRFYNFSPVAMNRAIRGPSMMRLRKRISQFRLKKDGQNSETADMSHLCWY